MQTEATRALQAQCTMAKLDLAQALNEGDNAALEQAAERYTLARKALAAATKPQCANWFELAQALCYAGVKR